MKESYIKFKDGVRKLLTVNRISLMRAHYEAVCSQVAPKTALEKRELAYFRRTFERYERRASRLMKLRVLLYLFLYASIAVNVLQAFPILSVLIDFVQIGSALFGTTVLFALVFWITLRINVHLEAMSECLAHVIALYHKAPKRDCDVVIKRLSRKL